VKLAVVLFNLGGPDSLDAVEPFLRNLFSDPAVIDLPAFLRRPLAQLVARRRATVAREIYARIGGRSPILEETKAQAHALDAVLAARGLEARSFVAMRCTEPFSASVTQAVKAWGAERIALLPLYPQFSTTTTRSSIVDWLREARKAGLTATPAIVCCFPAASGFVDALADLIHGTFTRRKPNVDYRLLLSAHGLPKRTIARGDPYRWQVERTAKAIVDRLGMKELDWRICFQSRVGPLEWIGPSTDAEIRRAGGDAKGVVVAPIAFVSEHAETLVELDMDYARLAKESGVVDYLRVPAVGTHAKFIEGLGDLVARALATDAVLCGSPPECPDEFRFCGCRENWA
jgi:protoporphyrin/coproporphyrin ferrochelatase